MLQLCVELGQPGGILARPRFEVRIVDGGNQRDRKQRQCNQSDGQRQPIVVQRRATPTIGIRCQHRGSRWPCNACP